MAQTFRLRRGLSSIDILIGASILAVAVFGAVNLGVALFNMTDDHATMTTTHQLARRNVERVKDRGFRAPEGTTVYYYNASGQGETTTVTAATAFRVTVTLTSDRVATAADGTQVPTGNALRQLTVKVDRHPSGENLTTWMTYLARGGI